jgi:1-acyl-sn-glycerol-3-phosphate acyltransferase
METLPTDFGPFTPLVDGLRAVCFLLWIAVCIPIQLLCRLIFPGICETNQLIFHRVVTRLIIGFKITHSGEISTSKPTLFICNHMSGLDIPVLASITPGRFVSKAEVANWPMFGFLARLQESIFIDRRVREVETHGRIISQALHEKKHIILFPEGTSTDGKALKPFKSALLQFAIDEKDFPVMVQPVSVAVYGKGGRQHAYPWYGDMELVSHIWQIFRTCGIRLHVTFHPPVKAQDFTSRKELAEYARNAVASAPHGVLALEDVPAQG